MAEPAKRVVIDAQGRKIQHNGNYIIFNTNTTEYQATTNFQEVVGLPEIQLTSELDIRNLPGYTPLRKSPGGIAMSGDRTGSGSSMQQNLKKNNSDDIDEAIDGISKGIDKIAEAIGAYSTNMETKQEEINKKLTELEDLYTRLQALPEDGFSEQFRIRVTDMKVKILQQMQIVEKMIPKMSASDRPAAVKALRRKDYTDDELRLFVAASDVLRSYEQIQNVYFDKLTSEQQTAIVNFIRNVVNPLLGKEIGKERFVKEGLTLNALCQDLIAQIVGARSDIDEMNLPDNDLEKKLLAETLIRVTTKVRPIGDSIQLTLESATLKDMGKVATTAVAGAAAATTLPMATSLVAQVSRGVASGITAVVPVVAEYPLQAYATIYHLISYITGKYEEHQLREPDFVFRRLLNDLQKNMRNKRMEQIFGQSQPVLGWYDYGAILKNTLITFGRTACGQFGRAAEMFETTQKLPQATAQLCSRVGKAVQTYLHDTANRMAARPGMGMNPALFSKCAEVMKELLRSDEYRALEDSRWVQTCLTRMGLLDTEKQLTFEKVLRHEATDILTRGTGPQHLPPGDSQEAQIDSQSSIGSLREDSETGFGVQGDSMSGVHDEFLELRNQPGEPPGTGDELLNDKNKRQRTNGNNGKNPKGGMKTKRCKSRSTIKRKSNKNKRKSRRYQRRASSRKGRK